MPHAFGAGCSGVELEPDAVIELPVGLLLVSVPKL